MEMRKLLKFDDFCREIGFFHFRMSETVFFRVFRYAKSKKHYFLTWNDQILSFSDMSQP